MKPRISSRVNCQLPEPGVKIDAESGMEMRVRAEVSCPMPEPRVTLETGSEVRGQVWSPRNGGEAYGQEERQGSSTEQKQAGNRKECGGKGGAGIRSRAGCRHQQGPMQPQQETTSLLGQTFSSSSWLKWRGWTNQWILKSEVPWRSVSSSGHCTLGKM